MICMTTLSLNALFATFTTVPVKKYVCRRSEMGVEILTKKNIFPYLDFSRLLIWYYEDILTQENPELNSFAISLRFG